MSNEDNYMSHIHDLTYFYVKKKYKSYLKKSNLLYIPKEEIYMKVEKIFVEDNKKYRKYIILNLKNDFEDDIDLDNLNRIFDEMQEDKTMIINRIVEVIDEYQEDEGLYDKENVYSE